MLRRERVEQVVVVSQHLGLAGEHVDEIARRAALEPRHHLAPEPDPPVVQLVVHRILHRCQAEPGADLVRVGAAQCQEWPPERAPLDGHAREPGGSAPAQQCEQDRLGLIVPGVPHEQRLGARVGDRLLERDVTGVARSGFEIGTRVERNLDDAGVGAELIGCRPDNGRFVFGSGAQPVVDVDREHVEIPRPRQREQRERVGSARAADDDVRTRPEIVETDQLTEPRRERSTASRS